MSIRILFVNDYSTEDTLRTVSTEGDNSAHLGGFDYLADKEQVQYVKINKRLFSWQKRVHLEKVIGGIYEEIGIFSQRKKTDVIVAANINLVWGLGYLKRFMKMPPIVAVLHSLPAKENRLYKTFIKNHLNGIDRILCITKKDYNYLLKSLHVDADRVRYVPWAVNPTDFDLDTGDDLSMKAPQKKYIVKETILDVIGRTLEDALRLETINAYSSLGDFTEGERVLHNFILRGKASEKA